MNNFFSVEHNIVKNLFAHIREVSVGSNVVVLDLTGLLFRQKDLKHY